MLFNSWNFLAFFFPAVLALFYLLPARLDVIRKVWVILASFVFYGYWKVEYVPLLMLSILLNYAFAEGIIRGGNRSKAILALAVAANLLALGYYKYTNFTLDIIARLTHQKPEHFDIILPLAISFFTFTQIGYLVDVYRNRHLHYNFLDYTLFVVFFPHLIAGPIIRHWEVIPQFSKEQFRANRDNFSIGFTLFLFGLFKKFLAESAALSCDLIYRGIANGSAISSYDAWLAALGFSFQIYFDFSSYSDMAIGLARMFGVKFPQNFDSPYRAPSVIVFWERWHITLTRFLREYVYFPLGGNRLGRLRQHVNILVTMLLSGLWHGAGWTFVLWGGLHGFFLIINHQWRLWCQHKNWQPTHWLYRASCVTLTFLVVTIAWVFFRSPDLPTATTVLSHMTGLHGFSLPDKLIPHGALRDSLLSAVGIQFVDTTALGIKRYGNVLGTLLFLLLICWSMPNTQQLLGKYDPILETVKRPSRWQLTLTFWHGLVFGFLAYLVLRNSYTVEPTPFIYFNF